MDSPLPSDLSALQKPLEHFRAKTKRLKIHPAELVLLVVITLHIVFLPWAIGGMRPWSQITSLILAIIGLGVALVPRHYSPELTGANSFRLYTLPRWAHSRAKAPSAETDNGGAEVGRDVPVICIESHYPAAVG